MPLLLVLAPFILFIVRLLKWAETEKKGMSKKVNEVPFYLGLPCRTSGECRNERKKTAHVYRHAEERHRQEVFGA